MTCRSRVGQQGDKNFSRPVWENADDFKGDFLNKYFIDYDLPD